MNFTQNRSGTIFNGFINIFSPKPTTEAKKHAIDDLDSLRNFLDSAFIQFDGIETDIETKKKYKHRGYLTVSRFKRLDQVYNLTPATYKFRGSDNKVKLFKCGLESAFDKGYNAYRFRLIGESKEGEKLLGNWNGLDSKPIFVQYNDQPNEPEVRGWFSNLIDSAGDDIANDATKVYNDAKKVYNNASTSVKAVVLSASTLAGIVTGAALTYDDVTWARQFASQWADGTLDAGGDVEFYKPFQEILRKLGKLDDFPYGGGVSDPELGVTADYSVDDLLAVLVL